MNRPTSLFVAFAAAWVTNPLIMLLHTVLEHVLHAVTLAAPLTEYLLYGYLPLAVAGIIIAHSHSTHKILDSSVVGMAYAATKSIYWALSRGAVLDNSIGSLFLSFVNLMFLSLLLVAGACTLTHQIRKMHNQAL